jgi:AcrR family transcriptional regulator
MSKVETINALIESATTVFSETGYEGASLRDIAAGANTPLSTINMYFGNKGDLFIAVMAQLWREIEQDRATLLQQLTEARGGPAELRDILYALVRPVVMRARSSTSADRRQPRILRQWVSAPAEVKAELRRRNNSQHSLARWIDRVRVACPTLSKSEAVWGFSFVVGALYSWELMDHRYDEIIDVDDADADDIVGYLVEFAVCGMQGLIDRAAAGPFRDSPLRLRAEETAGVS